MKFVLKVSDSRKGERLDCFLASKLKRFTRNMIQKSIKHGNVKVKGFKVRKNSYLIKGGDKIEINIDIMDSEKDLKKVVPTPMPIEVIYKDRDIIIINKDIGVPVHPAKGNWKNTLINGLEYKFNKGKEVGKKCNFDLVHRIDKGTSGIVIIALNNKALWYFSRQFEERGVEKYYLAIVKGNITGIFKTKKKFRISNYIGRHPKYRKKMGIVDKEKGRIATTDLYYLDSMSDKKLGEISIILAKPKTGRTHQIRLHLSNLGFPIIGDNVYGKIKYRRMMLHAYMIRVRMLNGELKFFKAPIPSLFSELFNVKAFSRKIIRLGIENEKSIH